MAATTKYINSFTYSNTEYKFVDNSSGYTKNTGTVTKVSTTDGLTGGDITTTGTLKANLRSFTKLTNDSAAATETSGRVYPVVLDKSGYLAVNVPWTNVNSSYAASNHTHDITLASDTGTSTVTLTSGDKFKLTAGGKSVIFTMPTSTSTSVKGDAESSYRTGQVNLTPANIGALATTGGTLTGDLTLYVDSGNSPALIFQRGTLTDTYNDWKIYDKGGYLYFAQRGSDSSDFVDMGYIDTNSNLNTFKIPWGSVTGKPSTMTPSSHSHGNINNDGELGTASRIVVTDTNKKITVGSIDPANLVVTTDSRLSDARTPTSHTHGNITNDGKIGSSADYAVVTTTGGAVTAVDLSVTSPTASSTTTSFIDTVSQSSNGKISATKKTVTSATTSAAGIVQLSNSTSSTSETTAATPKAVKSAYDLAAAAIPKSIGTAAGDIIYWSAASTPARLGKGSNGQVLKLSNGLPAWGTDNDTKNTAGSTDTSSKIYLVGATSQAANPQTYSDNQVYATNGQLDANKVRVAEAVTLEYNSTTKSLDFIFA